MKSQKKSQNSLLNYNKFQKIAVETCQEGSLCLERDSGSASTRKCGRTEGAFEFLFDTVELCRSGTVRDGTLMGEDAWGNRYYENNDLVVGKESGEERKGENLACHVLRWSLGAFTGLTA